LDTAHALALAGQDESALAENQALVAEAARLGHPVTLARAHLELGEVLAGLARRDEAVASLRTALRIAGAADARSMIGRAATRLLHSAVRADRFAEAEHILPFVESVTDPSRATLASLSVLIDEAAIYANQSAFPDAMRVLAQAEAHAALLGDAATAARIRIINELALTYDSMEDHPNAERRFREVLERTRELHGPRHRAVLRAQANLAAGLSSAGRPAEALAVLQEARALAVGYSPDTLEVINIDSVEGGVWQAQGDCRRAITHYQAALAGYTASIGGTNPNAIRMRIRIGKCLVATAQPAAAIPHFEAWLAQKVAEHASPDFQAEAGFLLAQALWQAQHRDRALATAQTARARYQEAGADYADEAREISSWLSAHRAATRSPR
jgi:tetratricopeptide (TPR) repeat protein